MIEWIQLSYWMIFVFWEWWISIEATKICYFGLALSGIGSYQVNFLLPLKLQKMSYYFGLYWTIPLVNQFSGFFTFDLFDFLILIPEVHCYIVLVFWHVWRFQERCPNIFSRYPLHVQQFLHNRNFSKYFTLILCNKNMTTKV